MLLASHILGVLDSVQLESLGRLALAAFLGSLIGLEREHHGRGAGFRTMLLVALGAALVMEISLHFSAVYGGADRSAIIRADIARAVGGVMGGIGFLGAGVIFRQGIGVRGLTTAASLWCTAAVGMAVGFGMYVLAIFTTLLVIFALLVLGKLEERIPAKARKTVTILLPAGAQNIQRMKELLVAQGAQINDMSFEQNFERDEVQVSFDLSLSSRADMMKLLEVARETAGVKSISIS